MISGSLFFNGEHDDDASGSTKLQTGGLHPADAEQDEALANLRAAESNFFFPGKKSLRSALRWPRPEF